MANSIQGIKEENRLIVLTMNVVHFNCSDNECSIEQTSSQNHLQIR